MDEEQLEGLDELGDGDVSEEAAAEAPLHAPKPKGNTSGKDAVVIKALIRDTEAVRLRLEGCSYPEIARRLKFGHRGNAQRAVKRRLAGMREDCAEVVGELRQLESIRLDIALSAVMPKVAAGDLQAIDRMLRIQERRAAYEGLDQPKGLKVEVDRELEVFLDRLRVNLEPEVFERVLCVATGIDGAPGTGAPSGGESSGEVGVGDDPDGS